MKPETEHLRAISASSNRGRGPHAGCIGCFRLTLVEYTELSKLKFKLVLKHN